jgi:prevent-host-death family protein
MDTTVPASVFKAKCLAMLDDVAATGEAITVTKHGRPVARLVPVDAPAATMGSGTLVADDDADYFSTGESWQADG